MVFGHIARSDTAGWIAQEPCEQSFSVYRTTGNDPNDDPPSRRISVCSKSPCTALRDEYRTVNDGNRLWKQLFSVVDP